MDYRRYGLHFEDLLIETPDVADALRRLPRDVLSDRDDRIKRAFVLQVPPYFNGHQYDVAYVFVLRLVAMSYRVANGRVRKTTCLIWRLI